jgi:hypothetical protein
MLLVSHGMVLIRILAMSVTGLNKGLLLAPFFPALVLMVCYIDLKLAGPVVSWAISGHYSLCG